MIFFLLIVYDEYNVHCMFSLFFKVWVAYLSAVFSSPALAKPYFLPFVSTPHHVTGYINLLYVVH